MISEHDFAYKNVLKLTTHVPLGAVHFRFIEQLLSEIQGVKYLLSLFIEDASTAVKIYFISSYLLNNIYS